MTGEDFERNDLFESGEDASGAQRLISRVVDGESTSAEWSAFCQMADADPLLWRELAEMQHQQAELFTHVMQATALAEDVEAPVQEEMAYRFHERVRTAVVVGGWSGWAAAAAAILLAFGLGLPGFGSASPERTLSNGSTEVIQAGIPGGGWTEALQAYLDRGRASGQVVGELPERILIDARQVPAPGSPCGGRYEVIYLRQIMERAVVDEIYGMGTDDSGRPAPVRIQVAPATDPTPM